MCFAARRTRSSSAAAPPVVYSQTQIDTQIPPASSPTSSAPPPDSDRSEADAEDRPRRKPRARPALQISTKKDDTQKLTDGDRQDDDGALLAVFYS